MSQWFTKTPDQVMSDLESDQRKGLSSSQAEQRLAKYGPNRLEGAKKESLAVRFLNQMKDPMIIVLLIAAVLSLISSGGEEWIEAVIILVIVIVNACISISQENSAEKALEALQKMSAPLAKVIRNGEMVRLDTDLLVPGDIIVLEAGDLVPADARILECANLKADESAMTGESVPVSKQAIDSLPEETALGDRKNMVVSSTVITNGRAVCVVTATGMETEVGRIAKMLTSEDDATTPLQRKMAEISKTLSFVCLGVCAVMFGVGLIYGKGLLEMFMSAVALAVAAIPEGLPAIVTIVLALGVQRMVKRNAIVKKLPAVETLGCAGVICSDKTGTLTMNKMTVVEVWSEGDQHRKEALIIGSLCFVGMLVIGFPYAITIGVLTGVMALIPIYGAIIGALIGAFMIAVVTPWQGLFFLVFIIVLQQLEGNFIYPRVVGTTTGVPSIYVFTSVTIGGALFGILGMLLSVPVFSIAYTLIKEIADKRDGTARKEDDSIDTDGKKV